MNNWPHTPPHRNLEPCTCMITCGTLYKKHFFDNDKKLDLIKDLLFEYLEKYKDSLEAWAILSNHYHIIVSFDIENTIHKFIKSFHGKSTIELNKLEGLTGRKVWYNYWDSKITYEKSYLARLNYVNKNPVHHGIVKNAEEYQWCSEAYYKYNLEPAFSKTVNSFKTDMINVFDNF